MTLLDRVTRTIQRYQLADAKTRVVAALSGGSDSVALVHLLRSLHESGGLQFIGICHFNHRLRLSASGDAAFCRTTANSLAQPILIEEESVADRARVERRSLEDAARTARHAFFERARRHFDADVIALGHTRDDQAETFLLRLLRGAGPRGLAGMHPRRGQTIRPLLECRRSELRDYLAGRRIAFVEDESNVDVTIPRNRVRVELVPFLERRFNPSIVDVLADEAQLARADWQFMEEEVERLIPSICRSDANGWRLDAGQLGTLPVAVRRLLVRRVLIDAAGGRAISFAHVEEAIRVVREGGAVDLPGHRVQRFGAEVVLSPRGEERGRGRPVASNFFSFSLSIPGEVALPGSHEVLSAEIADSALQDRGANLGSDRMIAMIQFREGLDPLTVRNRRPGDRFRPLGLSGRKKLQDFFVDRKVPRERRDFIPVVADQLGRIVWVAGQAVAEEFRVTDPAQAVIILRLKVVGGPR